MPLDELTGVLQRASLLEQIDQAIGQAAHANQPLTLIFMDLDRFLGFNEKYGHAAGDEWIKGVLNLFKAGIGPDALVGRYGGDEFMAVVPGADPQRCYELAESVRKQVEKDAPSITVDGASIQPGYTISIGLVEYPSHAGNVNELIDKGWQALRRAKEAGGNSVCFYEEKDALTGLYNHFGILRKLDEAITRAQAHREDLSLLELDIDSFQEINEEYGRRVGDEVLKRVASILSKNLSDQAEVGRYGGDAFLVVMPGKRADSAFILSEEVRKVIEDSEITLSIGESTRRVHFKISGGVASYPADSSEPAELARKADEALYRAKQTGRNRICLPASGQMVTKTSHYTQTQLERLSAAARRLDRSEAFLLREALDDLLRKYTEEPRPNA